jgi:hypothetical protein
MLVRTMARTVSLVFLALTACCGGGDGGGDSTGESTTGGENGAGNCSELCALAPVDENTAACVAVFINSKGYNTSDPECANANYPAGCTQCYGAIDVTDADCAAAHDECF